MLLPPLLQSCLPYFPFTVYLKISRVSKALISGPSHKMKAPFLPLDYSYKQ